MEDDKPTIRVIRVVARRGGHEEVPEVLDGERGMAFLEALNADVFAFSGIDARAPMRRDIVRVTRRELPPPAAASEE